MTASPAQRLLPLTLLVLPVWTALCGGTARAVGHTTPDLEGHLWTIWHATRCSLTQASLLSWPDGVDLLPILGGWADIVVASIVAGWVGVPLAYNLTMGLYLLLGGLGGWALGRALGLRPTAAVVCGLLLQLDPATLQHLWSGRAEQVGVGVLALFAASGVVAGREAGLRWVLSTGFFGALSLAVAWEYALFVAGLGAVLVAIAPDGAGRRRLVLGGGLAVALSAPAVAVFASHSAAGPGGRFVEEASLRAAQNALIPGVYHTWSTVRPATLPALCLLALPWTAAPAQRRLVGSIAVGLALSFALALGPEPALTHQPPTGDPAGWAPFSWLARLPGLARYQTPSRLMVPWTLAAPLAAGMVLTAAAARSRRAEWMLAGALLLVSLLEVVPVWPRATHIPSDWSSMDALAEDPHPGGVYDLPPQRRGGRTIEYQQAQMVHGRGIRHHSLQPYLSGSTPPPPDPFLDWALHPTGPVPAAALDHLRAAEFGFVVVHQVRERGHDPRALHRLLTEALGPPAHRSDDWSAWRLE